MDLATGNPTKRSGRRPLEPSKRRVQFGTRIAPETLQGLEELSKRQHINLGRVIDDLVASIQPQLGENEGSYPQKTPA